MVFSTGSLIANRSSFLSLFFWNVEQRFESEEILIDTDDLLLCPIERNIEEIINYY